MLWNPLERYGTASNVEVTAHPEDGKGMVTQKTGSRVKNGQSTVLEILLFKAI
jgi:hypothetical protein